MEIMNIGKYITVTEHLNCSYKEALDIILEKDFIPQELKYFPRGFGYPAFFNIKGYIKGFPEIEYIFYTKED